MRRRHGGDMAAFLRAYPSAKSSIIDLSTGINPYPYPWQDRVPQQGLEAAFHRLPDAGAADACKEAIAKYCGAGDLGRWALGPGSQAIIERLPAIIQPAQVYIAEPTYSEHRYVWERAGYAVIGMPHNALLEHDYLPGSVVVTVNPNNPDGKTTEPSALLELVSRLRQNSGYLLVDEAFADLQPRLGLAQYNPPGNAMVIRSFGKFFGLAGLRLGAFYGPSHLVMALEGQSHLWEVNGPALAIATRAVLDVEWIETTRQALSQDRKTLEKGLREASIDIAGASDLFVLIRNDRAQDLCDHLGRDGIYVRDFGDWPDKLRLGLPPDREALMRLHQSVQNFVR